MARRIAECCMCGKSPLSKDEIGISQKLLNTTTDFFCLDCLAEDCGCTVEDLKCKIEELKEGGCTAFG